MDRPKYGAEAAHFDEWREKLKALVAAAEQKQYDAVLAQGPAVLALYPEYVDDANAYELMAAADKAQGDAKAEEAILTAYEHAGGQMPDSAQSDWPLCRKSAGQPAEAAATLERLNYIYPVKDEELHRRLGDLLYAQKQYDGAIREYTRWSHQIPSTRRARSSIWRRLISPRGRKTRPRTACWPRSKLRPAIAPRKSCCSSCRNHPQRRTDKKGIRWLHLPD